MGDMLLCPSMMCANYGNLEKEVNNLIEAGSDILHVDVMDGQFVPNFGMGLQDIEYICKQSRIPVDVHLMIENPARYIDLFADIGAKIIYIHPESEIHPMRTLQAIKDRGVTPAIAINPSTSVSTIKPILSLVEYILVMCVNPGFAGQKYIESINETIDELLSIKERYNFELVVDGAISKERIRELYKKGVKGYVLGTSALFGKKESYKEIISDLRKIKTE